MEKGRKEISKGKGEGKLEHVGSSELFDSVLPVIDYETLSRGLNYDRASSNNFSLRDIVSISNMSKS